MKRQTLKTWVEIDSKALRRNVVALRKNISPKTKFMAVVKGDAYGHGMLALAEVLAQARVDYLAVFGIEEGIALRKNGNKLPILVLRSIFPEEVVTALEYDLEVVVSTIELLKYLKKVKLKKRLRVHLMVDTGLGRDGFLINESTKIIKLLLNNKNIELVGLMSHFSGVENRLFDSYSVMQVAFLFEWKKQLQESGFDPMLHISATAGVFFSKEFGMHIARFGIGLYGLWPSGDTKQLDNGKTNLKPVLEWKTIVNEVKKLQAGSYIGYDLSYRLMRDATVAILPVGYADGYPRGASNKASVLIHGKRAQVLGRVMMNMIVVDVTDISKVIPGDTVTLIGVDGKMVLSAEELAEASGTIQYELVTRIDARVPRHYLS